MHACSCAAFDARLGSKIETSPVELGGPHVRAAADHGDVRVLLGREREEARALDRLAQPRELRRRQGRLVLPLRLAPGGGRGGRLRLFDAGDVTQHRIAVHIDAGERITRWRFDLRRRFSFDLGGGVLRQHAHVCGFGVACRRARGERH